MASNLSKISHFEPATKLIKLKKLTAQNIPVKEFSNNTEISKWNKAENIKLGKNKMDSKNGYHLIYRIVQHSSFLKI